MSSRTLRKLQREQELQKQLAAAKEAEEKREESEDDETEPITASSKPQNAFDMLEDVDEDDSGDNVADPPPREADSSQPTSQAQASSKPSQPSKSKKKKKKTKKKLKEPSSQSTPTKEESGDEIDRALRELSGKTPARDAAQDEREVTSNWEVSATKQLAIDTRNLNPINEMKSLFGSVALEGQESRSNPRPQRRREQNQQGVVDLATALTGRYTVASRGKELGTLAHRRNVFMQGKEEWPLATSGGLSMEHATDALSFERRYNILHNNAYQERQMQFRMVVESMDPQRMISLLTLSPYHIATLLQVSEIAKHQGDHSVSGDLLERALFSFGRSVHSSFPMAMREGTARIPFEHAANRELYLTIWRYIRNLEMRGTWKTAFEWAKLLLQLNTLSDPYGVTLMIDQLALRCRSHDQLLKLASDDAYGSAWRHLPNIQISLVLAYLRSKQPREARKQLALAIHHYPYIVSALASALDISPMPKSLWGKLPASDAEKLYTELYVSRAKDLWNTPETTALIVEVADTLLYYASTTESAPPAAKLEISLEEARHIMLLEVPQLIALLPRRFTSMSTSSFDVLPPPSSTSDFTVRPPRDASGTSAMQTIINAGAATAGATGNILQSMLNFRNWFRTRAAPGSADASSDEEAQAALRDLQREFGREGMSPDMVEHFLRMHLVDEDPEDNGGERITPEGLGMVGGWDYYADAAENNSSEDDSGTEDSMPALEDIPTRETRPTAAPTPPPQPRNPRAAMVEEELADEDQDMGPHGHAVRTATGRAILRHVDSDSEDDLDSDGVPRYPGQPTHTLFSSRPAPRFQEDRNEEETPFRSSPAAARETELDIESDPQRLQRWLLTTGFNEMTADSTKMPAYARRLKLLRKEQQHWILNMLAQRGDAKDPRREAVEKLRKGLDE